LALEKKFFQMLEVYQAALGNEEKEHEFKKRVPHICPYFHDVCLDWSKYPPVPRKKKNGQYKRSGDEIVILSDDDDDGDDDGDDSDDGDYIDIEGVDDDFTKNGNDIPSHPSLSHSNSGKPKETPQQNEIEIDDPPLIRKRSRPGSNTLSRSKIDAPVAKSEKRAKIVPDSFSQSPPPDTNEPALKRRSVSHEDSDFISTSEKQPEHAIVNSRLDREEKEAPTESLTEAQIKLRKMEIELALSQEETKRSQVKLEQRRIELEITRLKSQWK
jgi:hypothetical protein